MKKEEKDAIRNLTNKVELWKKKRPEYGNSDIVYEIDEENKQIKILLCLVKSQQLEIIELKELIKLYKDISVDKYKIRDKIKELSEELYKYNIGELASNPEYTAYLRGKLLILNELLEEN